MHDAGFGSHVHNARVSSHLVYDISIVLCEFVPQITVAATATVIIQAECDGMYHTSSFKVCFLRYIRILSIPPDDAALEA